MENIWGNYRDKLTKNNIPIISKDAITHEEKDLGEGQSKNKVYQGTYIINDKSLPVVVKQISKAVANQEEINLIRELLIHTKLNSNPRIPTFYGVCLDFEEFIWIIIELVENSVTLKDFCKGCDDKTRLKLIMDLVIVVNDLHKLSIVHRDLKPLNVLVIPETKELKLIDFGLAKELTSENNEEGRDDVSSTYDAKGTFIYMPPESFVTSVDEKGDAIFKVTCDFDIWSIGCIISEGFSGKIPWNFINWDCEEITKYNDGQKNKNKKIKKKNEINMFDLTKFYTCKLGYQIPPEIQDEKVICLIKRCTEYEVDKRIKAPELVEEIKKIIE